MGSGKFEPNVFLFFEDDSVVEFAVKAAPDSRLSGGIVLAGGAPYHPAGSTGANAFVEAVKFHRCGYVTFTEDFCYETTSLSTAVLELPAIKFS